MTTELHTLEKQKNEERMAKIISNLTEEQHTLEKQKAEERMTKIRSNLTAEKHTLEKQKAQKRMKNNRTDTKEEQKMNNSNNALNFNTKANVFLNEDIMNATNAICEQDIEAAIMKFYINHGFNDGNHVGEKNISKMKSFIEKQIPTKGESKQWIKSFLEKSGHFVSADNLSSNSSDAHLCSCASCGICDFIRNDTKYFEHSLSDFPNFLQYNNQQKREFNENAKDSFLIPIKEQNGKYIFKSVNINDIKSVWKHEQSDTLFHLHPELIHKKRCNPDKNNKNVNSLSFFYTYICDSCETSIFKNDKKPEFSIANGIDFGDYDRIGLTTPSIMESSLISKYRLYINVIKIIKTQRHDLHRQHSLKSQSILFEDTSIDEMVKMYLEIIKDPSKIIDFMKLQYLSYDGKYDHLSKVTFQTTILKARSYVIIQWLCVLTMCHKDYKEYKNDVFKDDIENIMNVLQLKLNESIEILEEKMEKIHDDLSLKNEEAIGSDVANIRSIEVDTNYNDKVLEINSKDVIHKTSLVCKSFQNEKSQEEMTKLLLKGISKTLYPENGKKEENNTMIENDNQDSKNETNDNEAVSNDKEIDIPQSRRSVNPLNDIKENEKILVGTFSSIFMFGKAYNRKVGHINLKQCQHLFKQFTCHAALDKTLIFYLFCQIQ